MSRYLRDAHTYILICIHMWKLQEKGLQPNIKWSIEAKSFPYRCGSRKCDLCLTEKLHILKNDPKSTLNSRSELVNKCRHALKFKLAKAKQLEQRPLHSPKVGQNCIKCSILGTFRTLSLSLGKCLVNFRISFQSQDSPSGLRRYVQPEKTIFFTSCHFRFLGYTLVLIPQQIMFSM